MTGARRASSGGHTPSACESGELDAARCLDHQPQAETREKAVLLSGPHTEDFLPSALLFAVVLGLDVHAPYHSGMTGTEGCQQTRVSHHSEPAKIEADNG